MLNATGVALNPQTASAFYAAPIRSIGSSGNVAMYYNTTAKEIGYDNSSRRFKKDIEDLVVDTSVLYHFNPKSFKFINHGEDAVTNYGFIAEELEELNPELVSYDGEGLVQGINWTTINLYNICEVQKLRKELTKTQSSLNETIDLVKQLRIELDELKRL